MTGRVHVVGYLSIDRIEAGGRAMEGVPGGAALYAALAARAAGATVALHAAAGEDFSEAWLEQLAARGIDLAGVARKAGPTRRARLAYGPRDARASAHYAEAAWWERTRALAPSPPATVGGGDIVALMAVPDGVADATLAAARGAGARIAMDTSAAFATDGRDAVLARAAMVDCFAPSLEETRLLHPGLDDDAAAVRLAASGCDVLHKRGPAGAYAVAARADRGVRLPAPKTDLCDPTGAGDSTVGALAAGLAAGADFVVAATAALAFGARCVSGIGPSALGLDFKETTRQ